MNSILITCFHFQRVARQSLKQMCNFFVHGTI